MNTHWFLSLFFSVLFFISSHGQSIEIQVKSKSGQKDLSRIKVVLESVSSLEKTESLSVCGRCFIELPGKNKVGSENGELINLIYYYEDRPLKKETYEKIHSSKFTDDSPLVIFVDGLSEKEIQLLSCQSPSRNDKKVIQLNRELQQLKNKIDTLVDVNDTLNDSLGSLGLHYKEELEEYSKELDSVSYQLHDVSGKLQQANYSNIDLQGELTKIGRELQIKESKISSLEKEIEIHIKNLVIVLKEGDFSWVALTGEGKAERLKDTEMVKIIYSRQHKLHLTDGLIFQLIIIEDAGKDRFGEPKTEKIYLDKYKIKYGTSNIYEPLVGKNINFKKVKRVLGVLSFGNPQAPYHICDFTYEIEDGNYPKNNRGTKSCNN